MNKLKIESTLCVLVLLAGCGGGGGVDAGAGSAQAADPVNASVQGYVEYLETMVAVKAETGVPADVADVNAPRDETALPSAFK